MRRLESIEDQMRGTVTYELDDGRWVRLDARSVAEHGLKEALKMAGCDVQLPTGRLEVWQHGRLIGDVPADFEPVAIKSTTFLYDPRPGDFVRDGDKWIAARNLGPGDLDAVPGFRRARSTYEGKT